MALKKKALINNPTHVIVQLQTYVDTYGDSGNGAGAVVTQPYNALHLYFDSEDKALEALASLHCPNGVTAYVAKLTHKAEPPKLTVTVL